MLLQLPVDGTEHTMIALRLGLHVLPIYLRTGLCFGYMLAVATSADIRRMTSNGSFAALVPTYPAILLEILSVSNRIPP